MMDFSKYYRVYMQMQDTLEDDFTYHYVAKAFADDVDGNDNDLLSGKIYSRVIDMEWVEALENALIYIDKAIREKRRFIEQNEEIVPIERARKITNESIRHLAQHTSMISRVEEDTVTPERILEIQREESFGIYENRFLHTLLNNAMRFVESRYKNMKNAPEDTFTKVQMKRHVELNEQVLDFDITYSAESHEQHHDKLSLSTDISELSDFERVLRIRRVLSDFIAAPLMRDMARYEPVRPPILRTNLMTKNPNFRQALELWLFIETYKKPGYDLVGKDYSGKMDEQVQKELYNVMSFQHFALSMATNEALRKMLHEKYLEENERIAKENERPEGEIENEIEFRVRQVREEEMQVRLEEIRVREKQIKDLLSNVASMKLTLQQRDDSIKELKGSLVVCEAQLRECKDELFALTSKVQQYEELIETQKEQITLQEATITQCNLTIDECKANISRLEMEKAQLEDTKVQLENTVLQLREENNHLQTVIKENTEKINSLNEEINVMHEALAKSAEEINLLKTTIHEQNEEIARNQSSIAELNQSVHDLQVNIENQKNQYDGQISDLNAKHENNISELTNQYERKISEKASFYEKRLSDQAAQHESKVSGLTVQYEDKISQLNDNHVQEISQANKSFDLTVSQMKTMFRLEIENLLTKNETEKKVHSEELEQLKKAHDDAVDSIIAKHKTEVESLKHEAELNLQKALKAEKLSAEKEIKRITHETKVQIKSAQKDSEKRVSQAQHLTRANGKKIIDTFQSDYVTGVTGINSLIAVSLAASNIPAYEMMQYLNSSQNKLNALFISKDNKAVYFSSYENGNLKLIHKFKGAANMNVCEQIFAERLNSSDKNIAYITFSSDQKHYAENLCQKLQNEFSFQQVNSIVSENQTSGNTMSRIGIFFVKSE
ncbi:MAG: hypothetical protein Q8876_04625 [Bacillota bacterium]|nr:hypothetical protein [Bacillota bacterium]